MAARRAGRARPTRSSSPPARRAGWTGSTSSTAIVAGRSLLAWSLAAIAAAPEVESIASSRRAERIDADRGAPLAAGQRSARSSPGGDRRHESVAAGLAALDGSATAGERRAGRPRPRRRPAARHRRSSSRAVARGGRRARRRDPGRGGHRDAEAGRRRRASARPSTGPGWRPPRRRRASGARSSARRSSASRRPGRETWTDEAALLEACTIPVHAIPGDPANLKVTLPADLDRVEAALAARRGAIARVGIGQDRHPFGPGEPARPRRRHDRRRAPARRPLRRRRRRSTRSPTRSSARPASATSGGCSRPGPRRRAASPAATSLGTVVRQARGGGLAPSRAST